MRGLLPVADSIEAYTLGGCQPLLETFEDYRYAAGPRRVLAITETDNTRVSFWITDAG